MEDVIDVSAENLSRLKEEAEKTDADTIIRYIRIFSELSSKMKYATQKRILLEVALIKLCKPAMENNQDTLLERIRAIEEKIENGIVTAVVTSNQQMSTADQQNQVRPEVPKAVPEDIRQVVKKWAGIVGNAQMPLKLYLKNAKLSMGADNRLMVVVEDGIPYEYLKQEGCQEQVERLIEDYMGKSVEINIQSLEVGRSFESSYIDLTKIINIEIEEED